MKRQMGVVVGAELTLIAGTHSVIPVWLLSWGQRPHDLITL
jgi:hypothetical protein